MRLWVYLLIFSFGSFSWAEVSLEQALMSASKFKAENSEELKNWINLNTENFKPLGFGRELNISLFHKAKDEQEVSTYFIVQSYLSQRTYLNDSSREDLEMGWRFDFSEADASKSHLDLKVKFSNYSFNEFEASYTRAQTWDLDPCAITNEFKLAFKEKVESFTRQGKFNLKGACVFSEDLEGNFAVRYVLTDLNNESFEYIEIKNDLSIQVSKALKFLFEVKSIQGRDPLAFNFGGGLSGVDAKLRGFQNEPGEHIMSGFVYEKQISDKCKLSFDFRLNRRNLERDFGERSTLQRVFLNCGDSSFYLSRDARSFTNGASASLDSLNYQMKSDEGYQSFSLENFRLTNAGDLVYGHDDYQSLKLRYDLRIYNLDGSEDGYALKLISLRDKRTYVVAERLFAFPLLSRVDFETEGGRHCGSPVKKPEWQESRDKLTGLEPQQHKCLEYGIGLSMSFDGGTFVTAKGESISEIFGHNLDWTWTVGAPLNDRGINQSFGADRFGGNDKAFFEIAWESPNCGDLGQLCSEMSLEIKEGGEAVFNFGSLIEF